MQSFCTYFTAQKFNRKTPLRVYLRSDLIEMLWLEMGPALSFIIFVPTTISWTFIMDSVPRWLYYLFNVWPFTTINICPIPYKIVIAKVGSIFVKYDRNTPKIAKDFKMLAKVAKFRQIWSLWSWTMKMHKLSNSRIRVFSLRSRFANFFTQFDLRTILSKRRELCECDKLYKGHCDHNVWL